MLSKKLSALCLLATLGLTAGSAQAFGPLMLLMMPLMIGGKHGIGITHDSGADMEHQPTRTVYLEKSDSSRIVQKDIPAHAPTESPHELIDAGSATVRSKSIENQPTGAGHVSH